MQNIQPNAKPRHSERLKNAVTTNNPSEFETSKQHRSRKQTRKINKDQDKDKHGGEPLGAQTIPLASDATALTIPPDSTASISFEGRIRRAPAKVTGTINLQVPLSTNPIVQFEVMRDDQVSVSRGQQYLIKSSTSAVGEPQGRN